MLLINSSASCQQVTRKLTVISCDAQSPAKSVFASVETTTQKSATSILRSSIIKSWEGESSVTLHVYLVIKIKYVRRSCGECSQGNADNCLEEHCVIGDGIGRGYLSLNFNLPGPKIEVCKDDIIVVDLYNDADGLSTSIHWHGMRQLGTQFMDGVPYLSQCPIPFGENFRYSFYASDEGTHFYHSHAGHQKADGVYGALVVRGIDRANPNRALYDLDLPEHTMLMADWMHEVNFTVFHQPNVLYQKILECRRSHARDYTTIDFITEHSYQRTRAFL